MSQDSFWRVHVTYVTVEWKIKHFESLIEDRELVVHSPAFWMLDTQWYLEIWPNGSSLEQDKGWIRLGIGKIFSDSKVHRLKGSICMLKRDRTPYKMVDLDHLITSYGVRDSKFVNVSDLKGCFEDVLFPDGALHVCASFKIWIEDQSSFSIPRKRPFEVSNPDEFYSKWSVNRLTSLPEMEIFDFKSKPFKVASAKWSLLIIPHAEVPSWMSLVLLRKSFLVDTQTVAFTIGVTKGDGTLFRSIHFEYEFSPENERYEFAYFIKSSEFLDSEDAVASGSSLTVFWIGRAISAVQNVVEDSAQGCSYQEEKDSLSAPFDSDKDLKSSCEMLKENFRNCFLSERFSDFAFHVQDEKFPAHRAILAARSPFFSTLFENDTEEESTIGMKIENVDPKIFKEFLSFLYSGDVKIISPNNAADLLKAAQKYQLQDLEDECNLYIRNVWDIVTDVDQVNITVPECYKEMHVNVDCDKREVLLTFLEEQE